MSIEGNKILEKLDKIEQLLYNRRKEDDEHIIIKQKDFFGFKEDSLKLLRKQLHNSFLICDNEKELDLVKENLIKLIEEEYNKEKKMKEIFWDSLK